MKKKTNIIELFVIFFLSLTPLLWLKNGLIILGHDSGFRLNPVQHLVNLFYSWNFVFNFGADWSILKGFLITQFPETIFSILSGSVAGGEKISFVMWFFVIGISMYTFVNSFFPKKEYWIFRISSAVFYMYNFFLLQGWFIVERAKFSIYAALPFGFLIIYRTLTKSYSIPKGFILFSLLTFFLNGGGNPTLYGSLIIVYTLVYLFITLVNFLQGGLRELLYSIKVGLFFALGFLFINAYWIFPQLYLFLNKYSSSLSGAGGIEGIINWEAVVNKHTSFINLFRLQGIPDWYNNPSHVYANDFLNNPLLIVLSFIPVLIIALGFYYHKQISSEVRKDKLLFLIVLIYLVGLMFSAGSHPPLGFIYIFLIEKIPGFFMFRSAFFKFGTIFWFSSVFLTCYYMNLLILKFVKNKLWVNIIGVIVIMFILLYHYPYFSGSFFDWKKPLTTRVYVPEYIEEAASYLNKSTDTNTRILLLPRLDSNYHADSYEWGYFSLDAFPRLTINRSIVANDGGSSMIISAIYDAIDRNDERAFLRLTGLTGINKILWRGDVSYSDKSSSKADLLIAENNIARFNGVSLEKQFDKWKVYSISSQFYLPLFYIPVWEINAKSQETFAGDIISSNDSVKPAVLFYSALINKSKDFQSLFKETIVEAACIMCAPNDLDEKQQGVIIPNAKILPDSPFYFLIVQKEKKQISAFENEPIQLIDVNLSFANKRLSELKQIIERHSEELSRVLVDDAIVRYKTLMAGAMDSSSELPEDAQNNARIKILYYLQAQYNYLSRVEDKDGFVQDSLDDLASFITDLMSNISSQVWIASPKSGEFKYMFTLTDGGVYDIKINEIGDNQPIKLIADDKELTSLKNNHFSAGIHKLNVVYEFPKNILASELATQSGTLDLKIDDKVTFPLTDFNDEGDYTVSFNYKTIRGITRLSIIEDAGDYSKINRIQLEQNGTWDAFHYELKPMKGSNYAYLQFYLRGFDQYGAELEIKDLIVNKYFRPKVFLSSTLLQTKERVPQISYEKIDQTRYTVHVQGADEPYLLIFGENFDGGWKAYLSDTHASITEANHLMVNDYANGWLINRTGYYDIMIEYWPQRLFYIGLVTSGASIIFILLSVIYIKKGKKK